jgi:hypothetical protein
MIKQTATSRTKFYGYDMAVRVKYVGEERHEHQKHLDKACADINRDGGRVTHVEHAAVNGPYERLMVSTVIFYETAE